MGKDRRLTFEQDFLCGGFAGLLSRSFTAPLDLVKILAQVGTSDTQHGFVKTFINVYKNEGITAFWKGNVIACLRLFPFAGIQFSVNQQCRALFSDQNGKLSTAATFAGGSISGVAATLATYPMDVIKTRLTIQTAGSKYRGMAHAFRTVYIEEGVRGLYGGLAISLLGIIPFAGCTFMSYELLQSLWGKPKNELSGWQAFLNGCLSGAISQTFTFPFDTIKKKMQAQYKSTSAADVRLMQGDVEFNGMVDCIRKTVQKHGVLGLWKGTTANIIKVAPYAGLMFFGFETAKRQFLYYNGYTTSPWAEKFKPGVDQNLTPSELKSKLKLQSQ